MHRAIALTERPATPLPAAPTVGRRGACHPVRGDRRVRIAYCIDNLGIGGTELNAVRTAERLDRSRFDVSIICFSEGGPLAARCATAGVPIVRFPFRKLYSAGAVRRGVQFTRFLSENRIQIVHSHDMYTNVFATVCARAARTPVIIASRRWWWSVPARRYRLANKVAFRLADCIVANSWAVASTVRTRDGIRPERVAVVPNFVDDGAFAPLSADQRTTMLRELGVPSDALVVGVIANLLPVKDHATLVRAMGLLAPVRPHLHTVLIGDGQCRAALASLAHTLGLEGRVHFAGKRSNEPNLHHLFDVSVLCSLSEGFPNSVVEAMAAARPIVATDVGGVAEAVVDGETGLLVPPANPGRLAAAIDELLLDPKRRATLGAAARDRARRHYHAAAVLGSLEALYDRLLDGAI